MEEGLRKSLETMARCVREGHRLAPDPLSKRTDADEVAIFLGTLLKKAGAEIRFKVVSQDERWSFHHVFVEVWYPDGHCWVPLDPRQCTKCWAKTTFFKV